MNATEYVEAYNNIANLSKQLGKPSVLLYYLRDLLAADIDMLTTHPRLTAALITDIDRIVAKLRTPTT